MSSFGWWLSRMPERAVHFLRVGWSAAWRAVGWLLFKLVCVAVATASLGLLFKELISDKPSAALITAAGVLVLLAALFARHEDLLAARLKKLGPLELFEEVRGTLSFLDDITQKLQVPEVLLASEDSETNPLTITPAKLTSAEKFFSEQADSYAAALQFGGTEPSSEVSRKKYFQLLFVAGSYAFLKNEWPRAVARLERLEDLSKGGYRPADALYLSGVSYCYWEETVEDRKERREYFQKAKSSLLRLVKSGEAPYKAYFFLAYAQDELGLWREATESNAEVLRRRPRFAPAKYNSAISYLKLGELSKAYRMLRGIDAEDNSVDQILQWYDKDEELLPRIGDQYWKRSIQLLLQETARRREAKRRGPGEGTEQN